MKHALPLLMTVFVFFTQIANGAVMLTTTFDSYTSASLSGQIAWGGGTGTWAVSGSVNSPQIAALVIGAGVDPATNPFGGSGKMVRVCTEKFNNGRTKAWLDLANSGQWASASTGGRTVLQTRIKIFLPASQALPSGFGIMISKSSFETSGGFVVSAQSGEISLLNGGYVLANRVPTGFIVPLGQWNDFVYRWNVATGQGELRANGTLVATHQTTLFGSVYASNLLAVTDATPGALNGFGYFDNFEISSELPTPACPADRNGDGTVDASDLASVLAGWGGPAGDVNNDGTTDGTDLAALLGAWGSCGG
ncbi:MAG: dockerin type I repeat-containing protein [Planctomycetota bacterium]